MAVHTRCHLSRTEGAEDAEPRNVIAWRHRRSAISQRFCILREFEDFGGILFVSHRGHRGRGAVFSVSVTDTWLSIRNTICLAQRTQRERSPATSLHGATGAVGCFRHHLDNQGDSTLRLLSQPAWNDAGGGLPPSFIAPQQPRMV